MARGERSNPTTPQLTPSSLLQVVEEKLPVEVKTAPFDPRFPTTNQAKHCFTRYNEFHKCAKEKDAEDPQCLKYKRFAATICPSDWTTKWDEQRENGTWAGKY